MPISCWATGQLAGISLQDVRSPQSTDIFLSLSFFSYSLNYEFCQHLFPPFVLYSQHKAQTLTNIQVAHKYMIVSFEVYCSWRLCQLQAQIFEQDTSAEPLHKVRLQIGSASHAFLITNLIYPVSWDSLRCKPHKVCISALIKPSFFWWL